MGLRPRLNATAAFAAYWNPGLAPGGSNPCVSIVWGHGDVRFPVHLRQCLELALAFGGFIWIGSRSLWVLNPEPVQDLTRAYTIEYIVLAGAVLLALLLQFPHGTPHLSMLWFCLGMATVMTALGVMYLGPTLVLALAPGWTAGILATVRTRGNWHWLLWWFWAGVIAQIVWMAVLLFVALMTASYRAAFELGPPQ